MPKKLRTAEKILFILHFFGDFLEDDHNPLGLFSGSYKSVYSFTSNKKVRNHFQQAVYRLVREGRVVRLPAQAGQLTDGRVLLRLTALGRNALLKSFPNLNFRPRRVWDGHWRLVSFDVGESYRKVRGLLRSILSDFGFRRLQESLYITPLRVENELKSYLESTQLIRFIHIFVSKSLPEDRRRYGQLWHLDDLNEVYRRILKDFEVNGNLPLLRFRFLEAAASDPYLPVELLPDDWLGDYVEKKALQRLILPVG